MDEDLIFNSNYSKLQDELTEAESKLHLARTQRNEAMTRIGELVKELEQCKTPESPETEAERERKALIADRLGVPSGGFLGPHVLNALDERDHLRKAHSEADNSANNMYNANVVLSKEIHSVRLELGMAMQAVKNLEIACEQSENELKALKAATSGGEVYVTGNGAPLSTIQRMAENQGYSTEPPAMPTPLPSTIEALNFDPPAIAHLSTRPEGLPTADELAKIGADAWNACAGERHLGVRDRARATAIRDALRPWLRDPVGCELDVTAEEWADKCREFWTISVKTKDAFDLELKDFIKSRIRPAYECKECAGLKQRLHHAAVAWRKIRDDEASDALDAALEGE